MAVILHGSLASFLSNAKPTLHSAIINQQRVTIVLGNASEDLDSIASSVFLAYIKSSAPSDTPLTNASVNRHQPTYQYPPLYIPVVNASLKSLKGRPDILNVLHHANLQLEHVITLDDLETNPPAGLNPDNTSKLQPQYTRLVLTGQSRLTGQLSPDYDTCVLGYIANDHDQVSDPNSTTSENHIAITAGSCTSLIVDHYRESWNTLSTGGSSSAVGSAQDDAAVGFDDARTRQKWDAQIAKLALAGILSATENLKDREKTTKHDIAACRYLEAKITLADVS